jgi:hypothetical protein
VVAGGQFHVRFVLVPSALGVRLRPDDGAEATLWLSNLTAARAQRGRAHGADSRLPRRHRRLDRLSTRGFSCHRSMHGHHYRPQLRACSVCRRAHAASGSDLTARGRVGSGTRGQMFRAGAVGGSQRRTPEQPKRWRTQPDPPAAPARILNAWLPRDLFLTALRDQLTSLLLDRQTRCLSRRPALEAAGTS